MPTRTVNQILIFIMLLVTGASLAGAGYIFKNNHDLFWKYIVSDTTNVKLGTPLENCKAIAARLAMTPEDPARHKGNLVFSQKDINNPEMLFSKMSSMVMACSQYRLDYMCAGSECPDTNEFSATLVKIE